MTTVATSAGKEILLYASGKNEKGKAEQKDEPMPGWMIGLIVVGCVASLAITAIVVKLVSYENKHFLDT